MNAKKKKEREFLRSRRDRLFNGDSNFKAGDIVYDEKNGETSIVVGPADRSGSDFDDINGEITKNPAILLLTKDQENESGGVRVRYTRKNKSRKLEDFRGIGFPRNDLRTFCDSQCIQECNEDCVLWKYKKI